MSHAHQVTDKTSGRLRSYFNSKDDWNLWRSLKNLVEQAVRDYEHRALMELLQNAHDAHDPGGRDGRVLVRLDESLGNHGTLYVANTGRPFTQSNFDSITDIAQSDKRPDEGIGNKGIGFKSVLQLSRQPEIYSCASPPSTQDGESRTFDGYCFGFASADDLSWLLEEDASRMQEVMQDVFHLCLPVPLHTVPDDVQMLANSGFVTVVKLPLKSAEALVEARQQVGDLSSQPPTLLFLRRIAELRVDHGELSTSFRRVERPLAIVGDVSLVEVDLGDIGCFIVGEKVVSSQTLQAAIQRSIEGEHISSGWQDWEGQASVAVALRTDAELIDGRLYTYLPMGPDAHSPLPAHVNAPFFAKLARVNFEESVPLNDMLLDEVATLSATLLLATRDGLMPVPAELAVDLLSWTASQHQRLDAAFLAKGLSLPDTAIVPLSGIGPAWGQLRTCFSWPDNDQIVLTGDALRTQANVEVVTSSLSDRRLKRLDRAAEIFADRHLRPSESVIANWSEQVAKNLASRPFDAEIWARFYDELARAVRDKRETFAGRRILIDDDHRLRACNSKDGDGRRAVAFFSPVSDAEVFNGSDLRPPRRLRRRVFFLAREIVWNRRMGAVTSKRPGRKLLEDGLVNEYRATDLLPVIARALQAKPDDALAADVLRWAFHFAESREDPPWADLRKMGLLVPLRSGRWAPATGALFGRAWDSDSGALLEDLVQRAETVAPVLAHLADRLVLGPSEAPFLGLRESKVFAFLEQLGVHRGLSPVSVPRSQLRADGRAFELVSGIAPASLPPELSIDWTAGVRRRPPTGLRPYTRYESAQNLHVLPGQEEYPTFTPQMRLLYARLLAQGLTRWPIQTLSVEVHRYNDAYDSFTLPTPAAVFLSTAAWLPNSAPGDRTRPTYEPASESWTHTNDAPSFATVVLPLVRRFLDASALSQQRARDMGVRSWDDPATGNDRVVLLADLLESGNVADSALSSFRRTYDDAWADASEVGTSNPWQPSGRAVVVVTRGHRLETLDLRASSENVYVQDGEGRQNLALLEQCHAPVLKFRGNQGAKVATLLGAAFGERVRRVSDVHVQVNVDHSPFEPNAETPILIDGDREWLVDLVAAALELRGSRFRRRGAETLRRDTARLRRIRLVVADHVLAQVDELPLATPTGGARGLVVSHETYPTAILLRDDAGRVPLLHRAVALVAELLGQPEIADTLRVALIDLAANGYGDRQPPDVSAIADVLGESRDRVEEIRLGIRRPEDVAFELLIPLVAAFDLRLARELDAADTISWSVEDLVGWLGEQCGEKAQLPAFVAAVEEGNLDTARRALGITLRDLNRALSSLGAPYQPLRDRDGLTQQFNAFVSRHHQRLVDALRTRYLDDYRAGSALERYAEARTMASLVADPSWVEDHLELEDDLMRVRVAAWLRQQGADLDVVREDLPVVENLRQNNRAVVLNIAKKARDLVQAWERGTHLPLSGRPGDAVEIADQAGSTGLLDFEEISADRFLGWLRQVGRWPDEMPITLELKALDLEPADLTAAERAASEEQRRRQDERRRVFIDGEAVLSEEENYKQISDMVLAGLTQDFLQSAGATSLVPLAPALEQHLGHGHAGTTAGRRHFQSAAQSAAIGLAGEVAALEWLKLRHPGTTDEAWASGYRNQVLGDGRGDDTLGYDLIVNTPRKRLLFEVKATAGDLTEFILTDVEMLRAQTLKRHETYQVLYVTHVLDGDMRRIHLLPNPLDPRHAKFYRPAGQGLRYRFRLAAPE